MKSQKTTAPNPFKSPAFWIPFSLCFALTLFFFAWELDYFRGYIPSIPRVPVQQSDLFFTAALTLLLSINVGLVLWQNKMGMCPIGVKRATSIAGVIGAATLLCPVCLILPASIVGLGFVFSFIANYLPILRIIAVVLLLISASMLWPKKM